MRVSAVLEHFLSRADWIDRAKTVDRVIAGDPDADVDRCIVTWSATTAHATGRGSSAPRIAATRWSA